MAKGLKIKITDRDRGFKRLMSLKNEIKHSFVKVGILDNGKGAEDRDGLTNAQIASIHEFGAGPIPERSFIRSTFDIEKGAIIDLNRKLIGLIYDGKMDAKRALGLTGAKLAAAIKNRVTQGEAIPPPNTPEVRARKEALRARGNTGEVRTLINTGRMIGALTWAVFIRNAPAGGE